MSDIWFPVKNGDLVRVWERNGGFLTGYYEGPVKKGRNKGMWYVRLVGYKGPKVYADVYPVNDGIRVRERGRYELEGYNAASQPKAAVRNKRR